MLKQLGNKAVTGNILAAQLFFGLYQQGLEKATLSAAQQPSVPGKYDDVKNLTDEELLRIAAGLEKMK